MTRGEALRRIGETGGMVKTFRNGAAVFELFNGEAVPSGVAFELIAMGRVVPQRDALFGDDSQTYKVREPA